VNKLENTILTESLRRIFRYLTRIYKGQGDRNEAKALNEEIDKCWSIVSYYDYFTMRAVEKLLTSISVAIEAYTTGVLEDSNLMQYLNKIEALRILKQYLS